MQALTARQRQIELLHANNLDKKSSSLLTIIGLISRQIFIDLSKRTFMTRQRRGRPTNVGFSARGSPRTFTSSLAVPWLGRQILLAGARLARSTFALASSRGIGLAIWREWTLAFVAKVSVASNNDFGVLTHEIALLHVG